MFTCCFCDDEIPSVDDLRNHVRIAHALLSCGPFNCKQAACRRSFDSLNSFCAHLSFHQQLFVNEPPPQNPQIFANPFQFDNENGHNNGFGDQPNVNNVNDFIRATANAALAFTAKLYSLPNVPRNLVQTIIDFTSEFISSGFIGMLKDNIQDFFAGVEGHDEQKAVITTMLTALEFPFKDLRTEYQRFNQLQNCSAYIKPIPYVMGERRGMQRNNNEFVHNQISVQGQAVRLRDVLKSYLELPGVFGSILENLNSLNAEHNVVSNFVQGSVWREMQANFNGKLVLPLHFYFDEFEPDHSLLSHAGDHKLGALYCFIPVVPQKYLSVLDNIFVASLFLSDDMKEFGNEAAFHYILEEMQFLFDEGITIVHDGVEYTVYFCIGCILGDNLGLNMVLGFAGSFSANFYCRNCKSHREQMCRQTVVDENSLRTRDNYAADVALHDLNRTGINEMCVWHRAPCFHCCFNVPCDIMHDLCEGDFWFCLSRIIWCLIYERGFFDLDTLKTRVQDFDYGPLDIGNKPPIHKLTREKLQSDSCPFTASEMLCLMKLFGLIMGDLVPQSDLYWQFYLLHLQIIDLTFCSSFVLGTENLVKAVIQEHHESYLNLFNENLKPKQHFMLHYAMLMLRLGPLKHLWCFRLEGKHRELKKDAYAVHSRINLPYTLLVKHQLRFAQRLLSQRAFTPEIVASSGAFTQLFALEHFEDCVGNHVVDNMTQCSVVSWVKVSNCLYRQGLCVCLRFNEENLPTFAQISTIAICEDSEVVFIVRNLSITMFDPHFQTFIVEDSAQWELVRCERLALRYPFYVRTGTDGRRHVALLANMID